MNQLVSDPKLLAGLADLWGKAELSLVVVRGRSIVYANHSAARLLASGQVIRQVGTSLEFRDARAQPLFEYLTAIGPEDTQWPSHSLALLVVDHENAHWLIQFARMGTPTVGVAATNQTVIVLTPLSGRTSSRARAVSGFVDLTPTEREILADLVRGLTISQIATNSRRSIETMRWHVRNMMEKTSAQSMSDLTRIASLLLPI